jgi:hypothetical protein
MTYRPWGPVEWALSITNPKQWRFVGSVGTEERSLFAWAQTTKLGVIESAHFAEIHDVDSQKYRARNQDSLAARRAEFARLGGNVAEIHQFSLMAELFFIAKFARDAEGGASSIILDVSSLPKRFFFSILQTLVKSPNVKNLLVTYTSPSSYTDDAPLYENIEQWKTLPGFGGSGGKADVWIVSVGFLVESLRHYVGDNPQEKLKLLVPFPAPLAVLRRTWKSVADLEQDHSDGRFDKFRVDTLDVAAAFDRIKSLEGTPPRELAFAPFGPKPTSVAMCLYAMQKNSSVHYPQPTIYHPDYSKGIGNDGSSKAISAYWIKHEGEFLYSA